MRVLIVEDDFEARAALGSVLRDAGHEVLEAPDARTALHLASTRQPDLVLQDLILPDAPGFELLEQLRALPGGDRLPIVAISGFAERQRDAIAEGTRFDAYLTKPFKSAALLEAVAKHGGRGN
jgi:CheY-like chemotaxis protein